jgi:hypothetical protein
MPALHHAIRLRAVSTLELARSAIHLTCASLHTVASFAKPAPRRTGRPAREEWASLPSRCTSPSPARHQVFGLRVGEEPRRPLDQAPGAHEAANPLTVAAAATVTA